MIFYSIFINILLSSWNIIGKKFGIEEKAIVYTTLNTIQL